MKTTPKMWLGVLAVFASGLVIGAVGGNIFAHHQMFNRMSQIKDSRGGVLVEMTMNRLNDELDLTRDQQTEIKPILIDAFGRIHLIHEKSEAEISVIMGQVSDLIARHLSEEQREKMKQAPGGRMLMPGPPPPH